MRAKTKKKWCFVKTCNGTSIVGRGLCSRCYPTARYLVRTGKTTWEELEKMGLAKPKRSINASPLFDAFRRIKSKAKSKGLRGIRTGRVGRP